MEPKLDNENTGTPAVAQPRLVRRWRRQRPHCGGKWWFREDGRHSLVDHSEILLCSDGSEVASVDDAEEGTDQFYFEMTRTTQKEMPGMWMQAPANVRPLATPPLTPQDDAQR